MSASVLTQLAAALANNSVKVVDLTQTLRPSTPVIQLPPEFAPSSPFSKTEISHYDERVPVCSPMEMLFQYQAGPLSS